MNETKSEKVKCKDCRFAIKSETRIPIRMMRPESKLRIKIEKMLEKRGIVCSGSLKHISPEDSEKNVEDCKTYKIGVEYFGDEEHE